MKFRFVGLLLLTILCASAWCAQQFTFTPNLIQQALDGRLQIQMDNGTMSEQYFYVCQNNVIPQTKQLVQGTGFTIGRSGVKFAHPVHIKYTFDPAAIPANCDPNTLRLHRLYNNRFEPQVSAVDVGNHFVAADISAPGTYAIIGDVSNPP
ncbi:MAG: hypothetical protein ABUL72_02280, partial [Armatimonadota bacterium]